MIEIFETMARFECTSRVWRGRDYNGPLFFSIELKSSGFVWGKLPAANEPQRTLGWLERERAASD